MRFLTLTALAVLLTGTAQAADVARPVRAPAPLPAATAFNWSGVYIGLHGGYAWGNSTSAYDDPNNTGFFNLIPIDPMSPRGWFGGAQVGANVQFGGNLVLGIEADAAYGNVSDTIHDLASELAAHGSSNTITSKTDFGGTLRGRFGLAFDRTLFYGTGGLAWAHTTVSATDGPLSDDATLLGWVAGGGIEQSVSNHVSVKLEYLYSAYGRHTWFQGAAYQSTGTSASSSVRAGLNFHF